MTAADGSRPDRPAGKEPMDAVEVYYRVQETLRPLMTLCSTADYIWHPTIRTKAHSPERACRDVARICKASHALLLEFELSRSDCPVSDARDLLWWCQSVCVALNMLALGASHGFRGDVNDHSVFEEYEILCSMEIWAQRAFLRVADDHPQEWEVDSRSKGVSDGDA